MSRIPSRKQWLQTCIVQWKIFRYDRMTLLHWQRNLIASIFKFNVVYKVFMNFFLNMRLLCSNIFNVPKITQILFNWVHNMESNWFTFLYMNSLHTGLIVWVWTMEALYWSIKNNPNLIGIAVGLSPVIGGPSINDK